MFSFFKIPAGFMALIFLASSVAPSQAQGLFGGLFSGRHDEENRQGATIISAKPSAGSQRQRQADFLVQLRHSDPNHATIEKAIFNERNELGLILAHGVAMDSVSKLTRAVLIQMARAFPGQDLTVLVYAPSNPPLKIGTGRLNARTRDMTYEPARR